MSHSIGVGPTAQPPPNGSLAGQLLGVYRVVTELGEGGMGTVWYAEHTRIGRRVAIKVLRPELSRSPDQVARFIREAQAVNEIRHPNIVDVTDFGEFNGLTYLVMELLEGETLGARLERGPLTPEDALPVIRQIAMALGAAHDHGIVHRDLKPENIFLCSHDDYPDRVKVLDFGIAKLAHQSDGFGRRTRSGMVMGTPLYMSPEQCLGDLALDHRSDQYSLAVVIHEMLVGEPVFTHDGFGRLVVAHASEEPAPPHERSPAVTEAVGRVLLQALAKDADERFTDIRELYEALSDAVHGLPNIVSDIAPREPADEETQQLERRQSASVGRELVRIIRRRFAYGKADLPAIQGIVANCLAMLQDEDVDLKTVAKNLERDPLVATRLIKLVNTPAFGSRERIQTVMQAVNRLGTKQTHALLLEMSARQVFTSRDPVIRKTFKQLWSHCLAVGSLTRSIAKRVDGAPDPDVAYLAGLLHDVGKPIVAAFLLDAERNLLESLGQSWMNDAVWLRIVSLTHRDAGRALAKEWNLPSPVQQAIENQHRYQYGVGPRCANIVRYANALARLEGIDAGEVDRVEEREIAIEGRELLGLQENLESMLLGRLHRDVGQMTSDDTGKSLLETAIAAPKTHGRPR